MRENLRFLPPLVLAALNRLDYNRLYEIRLRADKPVRVFYDSCFYYLIAQKTFEQGTSAQMATGLSLSDSPAGAITVTAGQISEAVLRAAEFSIYAVNNYLSQGFITVSGGIRIGLAGEVVYEGDKIKTQKNFGSLVVRVPHEIKGCADTAYSALCSSTNKSILLISPPGCGKTTILRDLCRLVSDAGYNTLLVDERSEIAACRSGVPALNVGINTDVVCGAFKDYAFSFGIRSLRPDFIVTDELAAQADVEAAARAAYSGVNVIATVHAAGLNDIRGKEELARIIKNKIFGAYVFLSLRRGAGTYETVLDSDFKDISCNFKSLSGVKTDGNLKNHDENCKVLSTGFKSLGTKSFMNEIKNNTPFTKTGARIL